MRRKVWIILAMVVLPVAVFLHAQQVQQASAVASGNHTQDLLNTIFGGITAIGTFLVSFLAIFGARIRSIFIRPKLSMSARHDKPYVLLESRPDDSQQGAVRKALFVRVGVSNAGKETASNCLLLCDKTWRGRPEGGYYEDKSMIPRPFFWSTGAESNNVVPQLPSFINVAEISEASSPSGSGVNAAPAATHHLSLLIEAEGIKGKFYDAGTGRFLIHVILYANNIPRALQHYIEVLWTGKSCEDVRPSNFAISILSEKEGQKLTGGKA